LVALSEELCVRKASEAVLLQRIATMQQRQDAQRRQLVAAKDGLARAEARLAETMQELAPLRAWMSASSDACFKADNMATLMHERDLAQAQAAQLAAEVEVERSNLARTRDDALAQRARCQEAEAEVQQVMAALGVQQQAQEREAASHKAMLVAEMRRAESELKALWQADVIERDARMAEMQAQMDATRAREEAAEERWAKRGGDGVAAGCQTEEDVLWAASEEKWCERERELDSEVMMLEAQVNGLKEEAAVMQEQLEEKGEALEALQHTISLVASRENARAGGAAEALSKQLVNSKVENSDLKRRLKRAEEAHGGLRQLLEVSVSNRHPPHHRSAPASPVSKPRAAAASAAAVSFADLPVANRGWREGDGSMRASAESLRSSSDSHAYSTAVSRGVAEARAEFAGEHDKGREQVEVLQRWMERCLRLQADAEAALLAHLTGLVQAINFPPHHMVLAAAAAAA